MYKINLIPGNLQDRSSAWLFPVVMLLVVACMYGLLRQARKKTEANSSARKNKIRDKQPAKSMSGEPVLHIVYNRIKEKDSPKIISAENRFRQRIPVRRKENEKIID